MDILDPRKKRKKSVLLTFNLTYFLVLKVYLSNIFIGFFVALMFLVLMLFLIYGVELFYKVSTQNYSSNSTYNHILSQILRILQMLFKSVLDEHLLSLHILQSLQFIICHPFLSPTFSLLFSIIFLMLLVGKICLKIKKFPLCDHFLLITCVFYQEVRL